KIIGQNTLKKVATKMLLRSVGAVQITTMSRQLFPLEKRVIPCRFFGHSFSKFFPKIPVDQTMPHIKQRSQQDGHGELIYVIYNADRHDLIQRPVSENIERDPQHNKGVDQLGYKGRTRSTEPDLFGAGDFP